MGFPWKKLATFGLAAGKIGSKLVPGLTIAMEVVETLHSELPGRDKKAQVQIIASSAVAVVEALKIATPAQAQQIREAQSAAIDAYVAARNLEEAAKDAVEKAKVAFRELDEAIAAVRPHHGDGTGEP